MLKKGLFLVLLILVFLPSLASAISGLPPNYDPQINSQKVLNDYNIQRWQEQLRRDIEQPQKNFGGNGGYSGNSATSAPTGPAPNVDELIAQMNQELKLAKSYTDAADGDLLKIKNRNSVENLQVSIFGGDHNLASSIQQNIGQSLNHLHQIDDLSSQCNCIDRSGPIKKEADAMRTTFTSKSSQAEDESVNKGMIGEIMKTISGAKEQPVHPYFPTVTICAGGVCENH